MSHKPLFIKLNEQVDRIRSLFIVNSVSLHDSPKNRQVIFFYERVIERLSR